MKTLNDVETYIDDYGNEKNLTVVDHSPKKSFNFSVTSDAERESIKLAKDAWKAERKNKVRYLPSKTIQSLLVVYSHLINYDTDIESFVWDSDKLEDLMNDDMNLEYLESCINDSILKNDN